MTSPSTSLVWADGKLVDGTELTYEIKVEMGRLLGMSPVVYLRGTEQLETQVDVLELGAKSLGYLDFDPAAILAELIIAIEEHSSDLLVASLMPGPTSHKAAPPGVDWFLHVEEFMPHCLAAEPFSLAVASSVRDNCSPSANVLLLDDLELALGSRMDSNAMLWLNIEGNVACADQSAVLVTERDFTYTPPLSDGAIESGWRRSAIASGAAVEASISPERLRAAQEVVLITPWGERVAVTRIVGTTGKSSWTNA